MAIADLIYGEKVYDDGMDSVVIRRYNAGVTGGRTLNMDGFPDDVVRAGHIVIYDTETGDYKPMPVQEGKYASLPAKHEYSGIVVASKPSDKPFVAIMTVGEVNETACTYAPTDEIKEAVKKAFPGIMFTHD